MRTINRNLLSREIEGKLYLYTLILDQEFGRRLIARKVKLEEFSTERVRDKAYKRKFLEGWCWKIGDRYLVTAESIDWIDFHPVNATDVPTVLWWAKKEVGLDDEG